MGAGASAGIAAATKSASVDDITTTLKALSAADRDKLASALGNSKTGLESKPAAEEKPAAEQKKVEEVPKEERAAAEDNRVDEPPPKEEQKVPPSSMHLEVLDLSGNARKLEVPPNELVSQLISRLDLGKDIKAQLVFNENILDAQRTLQDSVPDGASLNLVVSSVVDPSLCGVWTKHLDLEPGNPYENHFKNYTYKLFSCGNAFYKYENIQSEPAPSSYYDRKEECGWGKWSVDGGRVAIVCSIMDTDYGSHGYVRGSRKSEHAKQLTAKELWADWKKAEIKSNDSADLRRHLTSLQEAARAMHVKVSDLSGKTHKFELQPEDKISQLMARLKLSENKMVQLMYQDNILDPQRTLQESVAVGATLNAVLAPSFDAVVGVWIKNVNKRDDSNHWRSNFTYMLFSDGHVFHEYRDAHEFDPGDWFRYSSTEREGAGWGTWSYDNGSISIRCSMSNTVREDPGGKRESKSEHTEQTSAKGLCADWSHREIKSDDLVKLKNYLSSHA